MLVVFLFFVSVYKLTGRLSDHSLSFTRYSRFACLSIYLHLSIDAPPIYVGKVLYALFCSLTDKSTGVRISSNRELSIYFHS